MSILVITPTTGAPELQTCIESVKKQTVEVEHLIVCDGDKFRDKVEHYAQDPAVKVCYLPYNTGHGGYYGHRVMAGFSHLVNHDYILFLDQDNTYAPDHVESLVNLIKRFTFEWAYSLRTIHDKDGNFICNDDCESLGVWPVWVSRENMETHHLIDTSSYCFTNKFLRLVGHTWDFGWGADRRFYSILKDQIKHRNYGCTGKYTLQYRLGGNEGSVKPEFFLQGNKYMQEKYNGNFPWNKQVE